MNLLVNYGITASQTQELFFELNSPMDLFPTNYGWTYTAGDGSSSVSEGILTMTSGSGQGPTFIIESPTYFNSVDQVLTIDTRLKVNYTTSSSFSSFRILIGDTQRAMIFYLRTSNINYFNASGAIVTAANVTLTSYVNMKIIKNGTTNVSISVNDSVIATIPYTSLNTNFFERGPSFYIAFDQIVSSQANIDYLNFRVEE
jgi:hypothetical protein